MIHHNFESELTHLERVLPQMSSGPFPSSYWQARIEALAPARAIPTFRVRLERLQALLGEMRGSVEHVTA